MNSFYYFVTVINQLGKNSFLPVSKVDNFYQFENLRGLISVIKLKKKINPLHPLPTKNNFT